MGRRPNRLQRRTQRSNAVVTLLKSVAAMIATLRDTRGRREGGGSGPAQGRYAGIPRAMGHDLSDEPEAVHRRFDRRRMGEARQDSEYPAADAVVQHSGDDRSRSTCALSVCEVSGSRRYEESGVFAAGQDAQAALHSVARRKVNGK